MAYVAWSLNNLLDRWTQDDQLKEMNPALGGLPALRADVADGSLARSVSEASERGRGRALAAHCWRRGVQLRAPERLLRARGGGALSSTPEQLLQEWLGSEANADVAESLRDPYVADVEQGRQPVVIIWRESLSPHQFASRAAQRLAAAPEPEPL